MLCLLHNRSSAQISQIVPFQIGERVPDLPLKNITNHSSRTAYFSSFGKRIIVLNFWNTHCGTCIRQFPKEDSLQSMFSNDIQFILVTGDTKEKVQAFLETYNLNHADSLSLPIITDDVVLRKMFRFLYIPHYVWIAPNGRILAQTSDSFVNADNIAKVLAPIRAEEKRLAGNPNADFNLKMQPPPQDILDLLRLYENDLNLFYD